MPTPRTLREIPPPAAERASRALTRRFAELGELGMLEIPHPIDLRTVRAAVELAELICGRDPRALAPWSYEEGDVIEGLAPDMGAALLDAPIEVARDLDDAVHLVLAGNRIVYWLGRNLDLAGYKLNPKSQPEIAAMTRQLLEYAGEKIEELAERGPEAVNPDFDAVLERAEASLQELNEAADLLDAEKSPEKWAAFLSRVSHLCDVVDEHADEIVHPPAGAPPALFEPGWWLAEASAAS